MICQGRGRRAMISHRCHQADARRLSRASYTPRTGRSLYRAVRCEDVGVQVCFTPRSHERAGRGPPRKKVSLAAVRAGRRRRSDQRPGGATSRQQQVTIHPGTFEQAHYPMRGIGSTGELVNYTAAEEAHRTTVTLAVFLAFSQPVSDAAPETRAAGTVSASPQDR